MALDLFSNPSNDYIYPVVSACPNIADEQYLTWTADGLVIIKGADEIANIIFSDFSVSVAAFNKQQKIIGAGEVTFIQGLTKGLCNRKQGFTIPNIETTDVDLNAYFMQIDISIAYYRNFAYTTLNIEASSNYEQNITIDDALNITLSNNSIKVMVDYDPSTLIFTGTLEGYDFAISNCVLNIIDTSANPYSPFQEDPSVETEYTLVEDASYNILYAKYPNTAMQGIILKGIYPLESNADIEDEDKWIYLNHISDYTLYYEPITIDSSTYYIKHRKKVDVGMSGSSTEDYISAGDYLNLVTESGYWKKVGEMYVWISSTDYDECTDKNLIEGFYIYNPHDFSVKVEYMVFV